MPFKVVSPGSVNISEIDLATVVPAVSTTEAGLAAHLTWGPVQKRILVSSEDELSAQFDKPNANTYVDFFTGAQFLAYANQLRVVRVVRESNTGTATTDTATARNAHTASANGKNTLVKNSDDYELNYSSGITGVGRWVAKYPGIKGSALRVSVCPTANAWESTIGGGNMVFSNNSTTVQKVGNAVGANSFVNVLTIGDIILCGPDKKQIKVASITDANTAVLQNAYVGNTSPAAGLSGTKRRWEFFDYFTAAPGTSPFVSRVGGTGDEMHVVVADRTGAITGVANNVLEKFETISKASDAKDEQGNNNYYKDLINQQSRWVWWASAPSVITNAGLKAGAVTFGAGAQSAPINDDFSNGRDGAKPRDADYISGMNLFKEPEEADISFLVVGEPNATRVIHAIDNIGEYRRDLVVFFSVREDDAVNNSSYIGKEVDDSVTFRNLLPSSSYYSMDSGWKYMYDRYNDVYRYVPMSGDAAGLFARTDLTRDPWYAAAGYDRGRAKNVIKLAFNPNKTQRTELYKKNINPFVTESGQGTIYLGNRTGLIKPSPFQYTNVRRLFIVLEKAIAVAAKFALFEFNDEFTQAQFRNLVEPFLRDVQGRRGIYASRVVCDSTNNTPEVIGRAEFIGDIYVKPAIAIEAIQLNFVAVRTGVEFSEVVGVSF